MDFKSKSNSFTNKSLEWKTVTKGIIQLIQENILEISIKEEKENP